MEAITSKAPLPTIDRHGVGDGSSWSHFWHVTRALSATEFKLRYFGSVLGYLWTLLRPLALFGVLYLVFTYVVKIGDAPHYAVILLAAMVIFNFFAEATTAGLSSLVMRESLIRKVSFPRASIPIAVSMTSAANLVIGLVIVFGFALVNGVSPSFEWLLFLLAVVVMLVFATALAVLFSILFVRYRDVQPMWEVTAQLLFWGTPIFWLIESLPDSARPYVLASPVATIIQQARHWLSPTSTESVPDALGDPIYMLIPLAIFCAVIALSVIVFRRNVATIAEDL